MKEARGEDNKFLFEIIAYTKTSAMLTDVRIKNEDEMKEKKRAG
jgi:hypothetical protein